MARIAVPIRKCSQEAYWFMHLNLKIVNKNPSVGGGLKEQAQQYSVLREMQLHVHMKMMVEGVSIR